MTTIALKVPASTAKLYPKVGEKIFLQALRVSVQRMIAEERLELRKVNSHRRRFERKYKMPFERFEKKLPLEGSYILHEDYGEWSYLEERASSILSDIALYEQLYGTFK